MRRKLYLVAYVLGIILLLFIVVWLLSKVKLVVILLSTAILLAYVLVPMVNFFNSPIMLTMPKSFKLFKKEIHLLSEKKHFHIMHRGLPRVLAIAVVYIIIIIGIGILVSYVIPIINFEFRKLVGNLDNLTREGSLILERINEWILPRMPEGTKDLYPEMMGRLGDEAKEFILRAKDQILPAAKALFSTVAAVFIIPLITFYILMDIEKYKRGFMALIPERRHQEALELLREIDLVLGRYVRGQLVVCLWIGISITIALLLLKIEYAFLIGAFAGIIDIIPYVGVIVGMIPAVLLAFLKSPLYALLVVLVLELIHWSEGHIIVPAVVGHSVRLPPLVVIVSLIIGAELMGILGMFLAVPTVAIIRVLINHYVKLLINPPLHSEPSTGSES